MVKAAFVFFWCVLGLYSNVYGVGNGALRAPPARDDDLLSTPVDPQLKRLPSLIEPHKLPKSARLLDFDEFKEAAKAASDPKDQTAECETLQEVEEEDLPEEVETQDPFDSKGLLATWKQTSWEEGFRLLERLGEDSSYVRSGTLKTPLTQAGLWSLRLAIMKFIDSELKVLRELEGDAMPFLASESQELEDVLEVSFDELHFIGISSLQIETKDKEEIKNIVKPLAANLRSYLEVLKESFKEYPQKFESFVTNRQSLTNFLLVWHLLSNLDEDIPEQK